MEIDPTHFYEWSRFFKYISAQIMQGENIGCVITYIPAILAPGMWVGYAKKDWSLARGISHGGKFGNLIGTCDRVAADKSNNIWVGTYVIFPKTDWNQFPHSNLCSRVCLIIKWKKFEVGSNIMLPNPSLFKKQPFSPTYFSKNCITQQKGPVGYHENWPYSFLWVK